MANLEKQLSLVDARLLKTDKVFDGTRTSASFSRAVYQFESCDLCALLCRHLFCAVISRDFAQKPAGR